MPLNRLNKIATMKNPVAILLCAALAACAPPKADGVAPGNREASSPARYDDMFPVWSPDGERIAFASTRSGDWEIYVGDISGEKLRRLTQSPGRDAHPYWFPDGRRLLFQSPRFEGDTRIFAMNADGSDERQLALTTGFCGVPTVSADATLIAFMCSASKAAPGSPDAPWRIFLMNVDGGDMRQITHGPGDDQVANWSSTGRRIVFWSDRSGTDQVYELDVATGAIAQLTEGQHDNKGASYSPDGRAIYFMSNRGGEGWALYATPSEGGPARFIARLASEFGVPYLSPDGNEALITVPTPNGTRIARLNLQDASSRLLAFE